MEDIKWHPAFDPLTGQKEPNVVGRFCDRPHLNLVESRAQDREIYDPATYVEMQVKGSGDISSIRMKPTTVGEHAARFPTAWEEYEKTKRGATPDELEGTPLHEFEGMTPERALKFKAGGVYTLEDIANMEDFVCGNFGFGTRGMRDDIIEYLKLKADPPKKRGRPRGSKNKPKQEEAAHAV